MKLYISGPISNPNLETVKANIAAFNAAEIQLDAAGHSVVNPVKNGVPDDAPWIDHMRADIKMLMDCDGVAYLPGWENSTGAKIEMELARSLGFPVLPYVKWL
jgi:hypothetical protein